MKLALDALLQYICQSVSQSVIPLANSYPKSLARQEPAYSLAYGTQAE